MVGTFHSCLYYYAREVNFPNTCWETIRLPNESPYLAQPKGWIKRLDLYGSGVINLRNDLCGNHRRRLLVVEDVRHRRRLVSLEIWLR